MRRWGTFKAAEGWKQLGGGGTDTTKLHTDPDCLLLDSLEMRQIYILFKLLLLWRDPQSDAAKFHPNCNQLEAADLWCMASQRWVQSIGVITRCEQNKSQSILALKCVSHHWETCVSHMSMHTCLSKAPLKTEVLSHFSVYEISFKRTQLYSLNGDDVNKFRGDENACKNMSGSRQKPLHLCLHYSAFSPEE